MFRRTGYFATFKILGPRLREDDGEGIEVRVEAR